MNIGGYYAPDFESVESDGPSKTLMRALAASKELENFDQAIPSSPPKSFDYGVEAGLQLSNHRGILAI